MNTNGYNLLAALSVVCATVIIALGADKEIAAALVLLAGTVVGRGNTPPA